MCGIAGYYSFSRLNQSWINQFSERGALDTLRPRGPDGHGVWSDEGCKLIHTRLAIIDLNTRSDQPMCYEHWVLSFNGEIFNFVEVRQELKKKGYSFDTSSDTEVLLKSIHCWGVSEALNRLAGMFAFAAYNKKSQKLHLVRDRMGIKPLYLWDSAEGVVFGSNCATIVNSLPSMKWGLDRSAIHSYFMLGTVLQNESLFKGIRRVAPAEHLIIDQNKKIESIIYWKPSYKSGFNEDDISSIIQQHGVSDVPVASFLSGGIDSSAVTVSLNESDVVAVHLDSPERRYAEIVAKSSGVDCIVSGMPELESVDDIIDRHVSTFGEPSSTSIIAETTVQSCVQNGIKVGILGNGGDELFLGYQSTPAPELIVDNVIWNSYTQRPFKTLNQQLRWVLRSPELFHVSGVDDNGMFEEMRSNIAETMFLEGFPPSASHRWVDLNLFAIGHLNITADIVSMAASMELRVPFLDHRLVEGALSLDANKLIEPINGRKSPLVNVLRANGVSPTVWQRPKLGFSFDDEKIKIIDGKRTNAMEELHKLGIVNNYSGKQIRNSKGYNFLRDDAYHKSSAHAFLRWLNCWETRLESI